MHSNKYNSKDIYLKCTDNSFWTLRQEDQLESHYGQAHQRKTLVWWDKKKKTLKKINNWCIAKTVGEKKIKEVETEYFTDV